MANDSINVLLEDEKVEEKDEKEPDNEEEVTEDEEEESEDEDDESEDDGEEEEEEEPELTRVQFAEVKGKFPNFFKEFPTLKHAFFREQQFSEIFPTVEEAKKAFEAQNALEEITSAVVDGDVDKFLTELRNESEDGISKFSENFLPSLQKVNKELYLNAVTPVLQGFIKNVYNHGVSESSDNIKNAAKIVHKVLFGGAYEDIEKDVVLTKPPKDEKVENDRKNYFAGKYNNLYKEVTDLCYGKLDEEIAKGLTDLKAKPGMQKMIAKEIRSQILSALEKDETHLQRMQSLWKREQRNGFSGTMKNSFLATFLGKSKSLLPKIRTEVRKEVLGKEDNANNNGHKEPTRLTGGKESKGSGKKMTVERAKAENLSTKGIFDAD